jgi:hypothetical protein
VIFAALVLVSLIVVVSVAYGGYRHARGYGGLAATTATSLETERGRGPSPPEAVRAAGGVPFEFNTIGVDDGIVMGHEGMHYSLPSRELIADAVETMLRAHCFDAVICIPNCDKITPGMLMGAARANVPTVFVSGGPMAAGVDSRGTTLDLVSVFTRHVELPAT